MSDDEAVADLLGEVVVAEELAQVALEPRFRGCGGVEQLAQPARGAGLEVLEPDELSYERLGERGVQGIEGAVAERSRSVRRGVVTGDAQVER